MKKIIVIILSCIAILFSGCTVNNNYTDVEVKEIRKYDGYFSGKAISTLLTSTNQRVGTCRESKIILQFRDGEYEGKLISGWGITFRLYGHIMMENEVSYIRGSFMSSSDGTPTVEIKGKFIDSNIIQGKWLETYGGCEGIFELNKVNEINSKSTNKDDKYTNLKKLQEVKELGIITKEEFEIEKKKILMS